MGCFLWVSQWASECICVGVIKPNVNFGRNLDNHSKLVFLSRDRIQRCQLCKAKSLKLAWLRSMFMSCIAVRRKRSVICSMFRHPIVATAKFTHKNLNTHYFAKKDSDLRSRYECVIYPLWMFQDWHICLTPDTDCHININCMIHKILTSPLHNSHAMILVSSRHTFVFTERLCTY